jgi:membrane-associated protease RseP (regulator of RpoE activity)
MRTIGRNGPREQGAAQICARGALVAPFTLLAPFALLASFVLGALVLPFSACVPRKGTIGAVISQDDDSGRLFLRDVPPGLAAAKADLKAGDEILLIDGLDVRFMDPKQIHAALVGEVDTPVKLTLIRDEQVLRVTLKRTEAQRLLNKPAKAAESER